MRSKPSKQSLSVVLEKECGRKQSESIASYCNRGKSLSRCFVVSIHPRAGVIFCLSLLQSTSTEHTNIVPVTNDLFAQNAAMLTAAAAHIQQQQEQQQQHHQQQQQPQIPPILYHQAVFPSPPPTVTHGAAPAGFQPGCFDGVATSTAWPFPPPLLPSLTETPIWLDPPQRKISVRLFSARPFLSLCSYIDVCIGRVIESAVRKSSFFPSSIERVKECFR